MTTQSTRCEAVGGENSNEVCTKDKNHGGPHTWERNPELERNPVPGSQEPTPPQDQPGAEDKDKDSAKN